MSRVTLCTVLGLTGLSFWFMARYVEEEPLALTRTQIERDLHLVAELLPDTHWNAGRFPNVRVKIVNKSRTRTHRVVQTGEGCNERFREPFLTYSSVWSPNEGSPRELISGLEDHGMWRCIPVPLNGWAGAIVELCPGQELVLYTQGNPPLFDFPCSGRALIRAHYSYSAGLRPAARGMTDRFALDRMLDVPSFELTSKPIPIDVRPPLELVVRTKQLARVGRTYIPAELFEVRLVNRGNREVSVRPSRNGIGDWLTLWLDRPAGDEARHATAFGLSHPILNPTWDSSAADIRLRAGEAITLSGGAGSYSTTLDHRYGHWTPRLAGTYGVRAGFAMMGPGRGSAQYYATFDLGLWSMGAIGMVKSEWVEVRVDP